MSSNDTNARIVEIEIRDDGKVIWVNTESGCILRVSDIRHLSIIDKRTKYLHTLRKRSDMIADIIEVQ